ncbi:MAG: THUMP domain-containing protein [Salinivirgaceae bacterium]|nr:THUMP domain-containing protein [Salinivirgaceae bacterium]
MKSTEKTYQLVAKTIQGLEHVLAEELEALGAKNIEEQNRAVLFDGDRAMLYRANYHCRTAISILKPIAEFTANNEDELYREIGKIDWSKLMSVKDTLSVGATTFGNIFTHSKYASLKVKDAIVDQFREREGTRPDVDPRNPDLKIQIHMAQNKGKVLLDSSGEPLFKRGYKVKLTEAPINEVLAAGMLKLSGWNMDCDLIDPMCGSGTILIEAAMMAYNVAPGTYRTRFGFERWNDFDADLFAEIAEETYGDVCFEHKIIGGDLSEEAFSIATENIAQAFLSKKITVNLQDFFDHKPTSKGVIVMNPPYGERIQLNSMKTFYQKIGDKLKLDFSGFSAWIIGSDLAAMKFIGLRPERKIKLFNGPLECSFRKFSLYDGSKKDLYKNGKLDKK